MSRRGVRSVYANRSSSPVAELEQDRAFYCGHCNSAQTGTHYRCQLSAGGYCNECDRDPGPIADGLVTGRTCRKCYDRNRRNFAALGADEEWTAHGTKLQKRRRSSEPEEECNDGQSKDSAEPAKKKSKGKEPAKKKKKKKKKKETKDSLSDEQLDEIDYGFNTPWGEHHFPGGSEPPVLARRSAQLKPIEYLDLFREIVRKHPDYRRLRDNALPNETREKLWDLMDENVVDQFAWAIPDERALRVIQAIDIENERKGVVEVGAGGGYWAKLMLDRGVDVVAFDLHESNKYAPVKKGTPAVVANYGDRILFLCYPDEFEESDESLALQCLQNYAGNYVIHVGELFGRTASGLNAWGRSTDASFQERLVKLFHQVVSVPLPSWPFAMDTLTVWKRTNTLITADGLFTDIPPNEVMDVCKAAPRYEDLLY